MIVCMAYLMLNYRALNALVMGEEVASTLGIRVSFLQKSLVLTASLMAGAAISVSGSIGFVGMMMPHIARLLLGADHKKILPASALFGGTLVVWADVASRTITAPEEMPVGIVTALVGAPFFIFVLKREASANSLKMN
jgi:iron complex transport system permease protein